MPDSATGQTRLAELVATLALVSDLGMGRPTERVLRQTVIALRLAGAAGLDQRTRTAAYYTSLLGWTGCAADTSELVQLFGDETALYDDTSGADLGGVSMAVFTARHLGAGRARWERVGMVAGFLATAGRSVQGVMQSHCQAASELATRLDLGEEVSTPLLQMFERWDGRGVPGRAQAADLAPAIRLVHLADNVEVAFHRGGVEAALQMARERRGTQLDPELVDVFLRRHDAVLAGLDDLRAWDEVIALDPLLAATLADDQLDLALTAFADFADLKTPYRIGHSRAVSALAEGGACHLGLSASDVDEVRRAGLVHDLGVIGVSSMVWNQDRPWTEAERERARAHPYLTGRMLSRLPGLAGVARCAGMHHERLDGSGYPHGLTRSQLPATARLLAVADAYQSLREQRPHRPATPPDAAAVRLRDEAQSGRLDPECVEAVLAVAGNNPRVPPRRRPGDLTAREVEVLVHLARGLSNPEIAEQLTLSRKTVSTHLEHIYAKLGVSTRTQAALYAMREGLVGDPL